MKPLSRPLLSAKHLKTCEIVLSVNLCYVKAY